MSGAGIEATGEAKPDKNGKVPLNVPLGMTTHEWATFLWRHEVFQRAWLDDPPPPMWHRSHSGDARVVPGWVGALVHWVNDARTDVIMQKMQNDMWAGPIADKAAIVAKEAQSLHRSRLVLIKRAIRVAKRNPELARAFDTVWRTGGYLAVGAFLQAQNFDRRPGQEASGG